MKIELIEDDLADGQVERLLASHLVEMHKYSPEGSIHALDSDKMREPRMTFWSLRQGDELMGCGALKRIDAISAELKSMKTSDKFLRKGVAAKLLTHILQQAQLDKYKTIYLETGAHQAFLPAINLYQKYGFVECGAFADYETDPYSRYFKIDL